MDYAKYLKQYNKNPDSKRPSSKSIPAKDLVKAHPHDQAHPSRGGLYDTAKHVGGVLTGYSTVRKIDKQLKGEDQ